MVEHCVLPHNCDAIAWDDSVTLSFLTPCDLLVVPALVWPNWCWSSDLAAYLFTVALLPCDLSSPPAHCGLSASRSRRAWLLGSILRLGALPVLRLELVVSATVLYYSEHR